MSTSHLSKKGILYVITCAARSAQPQSVEEFVTLAQAELWDIYVIATPQATKFTNTPLLEKLTNHTVSTEYRYPEEPDTFPRADAIVVFPATFNTLNKWALGITDTLALGILCEYMGLEVPIIAVPCVPLDGLGRHRIFSKNLSFLKESGIHILYDPAKFPPMNNVPFEIILQTINEACTNHRLLSTKTTK